MNKLTGILLASSVAVVSADERIVLEFSPLHLVIPVVEFTLEKPLDENTSVAGILGYGSPTESGIVVNTWEFGAQYRYYVNDHLDGFHLGAEALYLSASASENGVSVGVDGIAIGPMLGWKAQWESGLVLNSQIGYQKMFITLDANDDNGNEAEGDASGDIILLNLNLGWSF
jgi:hypothetical protein